MAFTFLSCCPKQERKVRVRNIHYCTLDYDFPIIDPLSFMDAYDSAKVIGILSSDFLEHNKGEEFELGRLKTLDLAIIKAGPIFAAPWQKHTYNAKGLLTGQEISSCYTWHAGFKNSITDDYLKIGSHVEGYEHDYKYTSYYLLDHHKRVRYLTRILYKDLYSEYETKQVHYNDTSSIPSKIYFEKRFMNGHLKTRGIEYFYKSKFRLDSIKMDFMEKNLRDFNYNTKISVSHYFSNNGLISHKKNLPRMIKYKYYPKQID